MTAWAELIGMTEGAVAVGFAVFVRIAAMTAILPAFGEQSIPMRIRLGLALAFTIIVVPASGLSNLALDSRLLFRIPAEAATGLFFGLLLRFFVIALQIAGSIAAQSTSLSQIFGGSAGVDPQPAMGRTLIIAGLAIATMMGLHVQIAKYMVGSYNLVPFGAILDPNIVLKIGLSAVSECFVLGFALAGPFVVSSLIYNVTLGVINKAMPQLMVSFVGAPAITAGGLLLLFLAAPVMLGIWVMAMDNFFVSSLWVDR